MDDIAGKITQLLNDPGTLEQIMSLTSMLGGNNEDSSPAPPTPAVPVQAQPEPVVAAPPSGLGDFSSLLSGDMLQTVMRIAPLLGSIKQDDDTTRLLCALRPFLSEKRQKKLDNASKILMVIKILPAIKALNIL